MYIRIKLAEPKSEAEEVKALRSKFGVVRASNLPRHERRPRKQTGLKLGTLLKQALAS